MNMLARACDANCYRAFCSHSGKVRLYNHCLLVIVHLAVRTGRNTNCDGVFPCTVRLLTMLS